MDDDANSAWRLALRYGQLSTPYSHFSIIAEGVVGTLSEGFSCPSGGAFMGMKAWASSSDEAIEMARVIGQRIGFSVTGRTYVYDTEPSEPPRDDPRAYDINFTPVDPEKG